MIMESASKFGFSKVHGNVLVWHLLHTRLDQICFLFMFSEVQSWNL